MFQGITNTIGSSPLVNIACVATGLFIGRKFCAAAAYKTGSIVANFVASKKAIEWNQASDEYLTLAKKNGIRDLTAAAGFIAIGLALGRTEEKISPEEVPQFVEVLGGIMGISVVISLGVMAHEYIKYKPNGIYFHNCGLYLTY
jgi:hypothetical protein